MRLFGRYVCALPVGVSVRVRQGAAKRMVGMTLPRAVIRELLRVVATVPARRGRSLAELPALGDAEAVLAEVAPHVGPWHAAAAYWPPDADRDRAYLHLLDDRGRGKAFLKLANRSDAAALDRERDALAALAGGSWPLTTPPLLASGETDATRWILTGALPRVGRQTLKPRLALPHGVVEEIRGETRVVPPSELDTLSWWAALKPRLDSVPAAFLQELKTATADGLEVGRAHGDFCAHNVVTVAGRVWVFDWEEYAPDAPVDLDVVTFRLERGDDLAEVRGAPGEPAYRRFVMCCAFGLARDIPRFRVIVDGWSGLRAQVE
ncbi:MAG TPA: hypothetical protein VFI13_07750 [Gemmatimonadales bacterium]|nr:hypothetical protein [Gemmatimonadales bacterium]